jgi:hypothetical protein
MRVEAVKKNAALSESAFFLLFIYEFYQRDFACGLKHHEQRLKMS